MDILESIAQDEEMQNYMVENEEVLTLIDEESNMFGEKIKGFILAHPEEFLAESVDETKKNILTFTEMATVQYMKEMTSIASLCSDPIDSMEEGDNISVSSLDDYL